jgi:flagellar P-ring protein precursor FlgI
MLGADYRGLPVDARRIRVKAPVDPTQRVDFVSRLENIVITPAEPSPKVIINARTGSVVMNQLVASVRMRRRARQPAGGDQLARR